ncbi:phosphoglycerate mutase family protein [Myriangium duriaei CBS 260.36]|uniref:Phosphoglycerate mutase family protein n=1 Tax=Myriangium duriaei CBS 260.36 TaxID=1168546 RepID=A0A9P4MSM7_9PEZI|nr:phosphoglycerate mutase family protein [Myriangium duriaei CBS 260.36]
MGRTFQYETVTGFFLQDQSDTDPATFDYTNNFGLVPPPSWPAFASRIDALNAAAPQGTSYRVLFLGRHGEGWHNVAESRYGTPAWDAHYSLLDEHDGMRFLDADLTDRGKAQAGELARGTFAHALAEGLPAPEVYLCSPLNRCLETCSLTFSGLELPKERPFRPVIKELLREVIGEHTCDKRSSRSRIATNWPAFEIEGGLTEEDPFWRPDVRETDPEMDVRLKGFLDGVFETCDATYISLTTHSGAIGGFLRVLGHRPFPPRTGSVMPVVVKVAEV